MLKNVGRYSNVIYLMANKKNALSDFIRDYVNSGNSEAKIAQRSGNNIKQSSINDLKNGRVSPLKSTVANIYYLAKGMESKPFEIFCLALGVTPKEFGIRNENEQLSEIEFFFNQLTEEKQQVMVGIIKYFLDVENNQSQSIHIANKDLEGISQDKLFTRKKEPSIKDGISQDELIVEGINKRKDKAV